MNTGIHTTGHEKSLLTANIIGAVVVGLIIGFIAGAYWSKGQTDTQENENATTTSQAMMQTTNNGIAVEMKDQAVGSNVVIDKLNLDASYWVAIRDDSSTNKISYILGARRFQKGDYQNVTIVLPTRVLETGKSYEVSLYKDMGGDFDYKAENLIVSNGKSSIYTFKAN